MADRWLYPWALGSVAFGGASLLVPLYIVQLGATAVQLGVLAATAAGVGAPGAILFGRLANRVGHRRPLVLVTLATVAVVLVAIPFTPSITGVILANAVLWLVVASVAPVLTMLVVDDGPESTWSERIGRLNAYQGYGWAGGLVLGTAWPVVAGRFIATDPVAVTRTFFWVLAACAVAGAAGAAVTLPRPDPDAHDVTAREGRAIARLLAASNRGVKGATFAFSPNRLYWSTRTLDLGRLRRRLDPTLATYLLAAVLFFSGFTVFWAPLPLYLSETGFDSGRVFALYLISSLASALLYEVAGTAATRHDVRLLQSGALALRGVLFLTVVLVAGFLGAGVALAAIGSTWAVIAVVGTVIVTRLAPPAVRGDVLGVYTALGAVSGGLGGVLGGWLAAMSYRLAFGVAGGLVLLGALVVLSLRVLSSRRQTADRGGDPSAVAARTAAATGTGSSELEDGTRPDDGRRPDETGPG